MEIGTSGAEGTMWIRWEEMKKEYVRNQLQEDIASDQMCLREFKDPFTGEPVVKGK